jgi:hypothetical protein
VQLPDDLRARVVVLESLGRLPQFRRDWEDTCPLVNGVPVPLEFHYSDPDPPSQGDGCYFGHVAVLDHDGPLLVLEDDCWFTERVDLGGRVVPDCDVFYLGGQHSEAPTPCYGYPGCVELRGETNRSHAYIVFEPRKLRDLLVNDRRSLYPDIGMARYPQLRRFGVKPWIAGQRACWSSIKRIDLPDREWQWEDVAP